MSLREELKTRLPDYVTSVKVSDANIHGLSATKVVVNYKDPSGKNWFLDMNFADKNKMNAEHIADVVLSYLRHER